ncbi:MAG: hypothetical protein QW175_05710, partial [Candidatus Bathyarchaeia archaeon]
NFFGNKASVSASNGNLLLTVTNLESGDSGVFGIHRRALVNLVGRHVEIKVDYEHDSDGPNFTTGIFFSNKPYQNRYDNDFRGVWIGVDGTGRRDTRLLVLNYIGGGTYEHIPVEQEKVPATIKVKIGDKGFYVAEIVDGVEKVKVSRPIDWSAINAHLYILTNVFWYSGLRYASGSTFVDYIDVKEAPVPESAGERFGREFVSFLSTFLSAIVPLALITLTVLELRRALKEVVSRG